MHAVREAGTAPQRAHGVAQIHAAEFQADTPPGCTRYVGCQGVADCENLKMRRAGAGGLPPPGFAGPTLQTIDFPRPPPRIPCG
ncbi:hypothetical protein SBA6_1130021 [Candidatus Sulfopaludibacter sp. SbA6]|nr:hypothetical protein SBA6_1130021 [Candidatus Sulfopaludibacter sp. SbA6]